MDLRDAPVCPNDYSWSQYGHEAGENRGSSALIVTESLRTLERLRLRVKLADTVVAERRSKILELIASLELVDINSIVLDRAAQPMPTEIGTLDAIHLATALLWKELEGENLTMATHDDALAVAAVAYRLPVVGARVGRAKSQET